MSSNFPNGFANGVTIRGTPIEVPNPGEVFWVNNSGVLAKSGVAGSNGNDGSYRKPFATIDYAIGRCTADRGVAIYVMPGHVETVSTATGGAATVDIDVAGVSIIGLGQGAKQSRFDFTLAAGAVTVGANDVSIINMNFHANVPSVLIGLTVTTLFTNLQVKGCLFDNETTVTDAFVVAIQFAVGNSNFLIEDNYFDSGLQALATHAIYLIGATAGGIIKNNTITGDYTTACIGGLTTLSTEIYIIQNYLCNGGSANVGAVATLSMVAASTGAVVGNYSHCNVATGVLHFVNTGMFHANNWMGEDAGSAACAQNTVGVGLDVVSIVPFADD